MSVLKSKRGESAMQFIETAREFVRNTDDNKPINSKVWQTWLDLITAEAKLLSALKNKDKERYKTLLE